MVVIQYEEEDKELSVGERVIIRDLKNAAHLNGMHGTVASPLLEGGRHTVDLDLMFPTENKRLSIKPCNLKREPPLSSARPRAKVENGSLVEKEGRAMSFVLDSMRLCAASFRSDGTIQDFADIHRLRQSDHGLIQLNLLTSSAWTHWNSTAGFFAPKAGPDAKGVYSLLCDFIRKDLPEQNGGVEEMMKKNEEGVGKIFYDSVMDIEAVKGWNVRVHGIFWIVGMDNEGTYLVPDRNREVVYQCVGIKDPIYPKVAHLGGPTKAQLTMIPWYGRLVYDGVVTGVTNSVADTALTEKLKESIEKAKREGRIIQRLAQLEVEGGSRLGVFDLVVKSEKAPAPDDPPSAEEKELMRQLFSIPSMGGEMFGDEGKGKVWIFRRMGYTEVENPAHIGLVMNDSGGVAGQFKCSALIPTPSEILSSLVQHSETLGARPVGVGVDDEGCSKRLAVLSREEDITFFYYPPPSEEETAAASPNRDF